MNELVEDFSNQTASLDKVIDVSKRETFVEVPGDLAGETVFYWGGYYNSALDNRTSYGSEDLHLDDDTNIFLPTLRNGDSERFNVTAFVNRDGKIDQLRINLRDTNRFLQIRGRALESTARNYFAPKPEE